MSDTIELAGPRGITNSRPESNYSKDLEVQSKQDGGAATETVLESREATTTQDAVWGELDGKSPKYRNLGWLPAAGLLNKIQLGLGVLALPAVMHTLGMAITLILVAVFALFTTYSATVFADFKTRHPHVYTLADIGEVMFGPWGREILGAMYWLKLVFIAGSGMLAVSTSFNAVTVHGTCTLVFALVAAIMTFSIAVIQTLDRISWLSWFGVITLVISILTLTVSVGVQDRPAAAPKVGAFVPQLVYIGSPTFVAAVNSFSTIVFAYSGTSSFLNIFSEMRNPRDFKKAIYLCQGSIVVIYLVIGSVVYKFCGQYVSSPSLGSAGPLMKRVCYGIALPGLWAGAVINTHLPAKYMFVRVLKNSEHLSKNTIKHRLVWGACITLCCTISFLISQAVPFFGNLISLIGALLATPLALLVPTYSWWFLHKTAEPRQQRSALWYATLILTLLILAFSLFQMYAGSYTAIVAIQNQINSGSTTKPFGCADNSGSV